MSPRVKPYTTDADRRAADQARRHEAVLDDLDAGVSVDDAYKRNDLREPGGLSMSVSENSFYGPSSQHSWFRDLALAATERLDGLDVPFPHPEFGGPQEARKRLLREGLTKEARTLSTTLTAGGNFAPPGYLAEQFAAAARNASVLPGILPENTMPSEIRDEKLFTPRITTGTTAAIQVGQNTTASNTDIVESMVASPIGTCAGQQDVSQQLLDHSHIDLVLASDLGRALGAQLDSQLIAGTGANSQALGLISVTGISTVAYTDATPTQQEAFVKILQAASDLAVALGKPADAILLHPRRSAWMRNWRDTATGVPAVIPWPATPYDVPNIPTTVGASTNEDFALVLRTDELPFYQEPPVFRVQLDVTGSNTLTARFVASQYVAGLFQRRPEAVNKVSGTGFAGVVFS